MNEKEIRNEDKKELRFRIVLPFKYIFQGNEIEVKFKRRAGANMIDRPLDFYKSIPIEALLGKMGLIPSGLSIATIEVVRNRTDGGSVTIFFTPDPSEYPNLTHFLHSPIDASPSLPSLYIPFDEANNIEETQVSFQSEMMYLFSALRVDTPDVQLVRNELMQLISNLKKWSWDPNTLKNGNVLISVLLTS